MIAWRDVTDARASERTAIFSVIPRAGVGHNAPLLLPVDADPTDQMCLVANLSSLPFDYVARQKVGGLHLTIFVLNQLPIIPARAYDSEDRRFIVSRVAELVCSSHDVQPLAKVLGYDRPFTWDIGRRVQLRAELDAYYAHLYGLTRDELRFMLNPKRGALR